jgi:hypothetical protein
MSGTKQHYLPASLIGSFGRPAASGKLREAQVAVRRKATGVVDAGFPKAETLAYRTGMYRLASAPAGADRDVVDKLWDPVENGLRDLPPGSLPGACSQGTTRCCSTTLRPPACAIPRSRT